VTEYGKTEYGNWLEMRQRQEELDKENDMSGDNESLDSPWRGGLLHEEMEASSQQPAPKHNNGPSMHDLVIKDILSRELQWDLSVGSARHIRDQVADDLLARKQFGLDKYGTILQIGNGRSFLLDTYQELLDASVYARGRLLEVPEDGLEWAILFEVYDAIVTALVKVRRLLNAAVTGTE
jgi:hypothetical protein